jgi:hypothetical protein
MSQHDYNIANQGFPAFRSDLNNALSAIQTNNSGTSRPTGAVAGQIWLDTTNSTSPTLKFFDGSDDISLATINYTANTVDWLDSSITITGLSTTATGTVLTLSDTASTSSVNLIIDNQKEVRFRETTANGTNYVALKAPASLASDVTFTLPSADGTANQVLTTNGSGVLSFATVGGTAWQSVQTSGFTAVAGRGYPCNTTSSAFTVTLPASATAGDTIVLVDYAGTFSTNALTISPNGLKINGSTGNKGLNTNREAVTITYVDSTQGWVSTSGSNEGSTSLDILPYSIDFLVIAGGAGGGGAAVSTSACGGGGAGGYRTSTQTVSVGTVITVTVGDGGNGGSNGALGSAGSTSSISGSGLTTITSAGGGGGGRNNIAGNAGGSGGGGGGNVASGGAGNTPSTSPSQGNNGGSGSGAGGGGGGAGAVGSNSSAPNGGAGGAGTASSITGSSVTRAGGGGGGGQGGTGGAGGTGGGGAGGDQIGFGPAGHNGFAGTANTGGGGGAGANTDTSGNSGGNGGKGLVILSVPTASYSSTTTGSPTVSTSGSNTIMVFNGSGSYTA